MATEFTGRSGFECAAGAHCTVIPADLITLAHLSVSSAMNFANPADVNCIGSTPRSASRAFDFGSARAALIASLSLLVISGGVFVGAARPYQTKPSLTDTKLPILGTTENSGWRLDWMDHTG